MCSRLLENEGGLRGAGAAAARAARRAAAAGGARGAVRAYPSRYIARSTHAGLVWNNPRFPHLTYDRLEDALRHNEFRILDIVDPESGERLYTLEHEVRSLLHPGFSCRHWLVPDDGAQPRAVGVGNYPSESPSSPAAKAPTCPPGEAERQHDKHEGTCAA